MNPRLTQITRLLAVPLGLLFFAPPAHAQLMLQGNVQAKVSGLSATGGASWTAKRAAMPPGYVTSGSITQNGSGVFTSALTLQAKKNTGSATLLYKPSNGTSNPLNAFSGIENLDTFSLGSLRLTDTTLPSGGAVNFTLSIEFASLQLFNGATALSPVFTHVPILDLPLTLTLLPAGHTATLAFATPYNAATMFNQNIAFGNGYTLELSPATTLEALIASLSTPGAFKATPNAPMTYGTIDLVATIISPVPEASTFTLGGAVLLIGAVAVSGVRRRRALAPPAV